MKIEVIYFENVKKNYVLEKIFFENMKTELTQQGYFCRSFKLAYRGRFLI